VAFMERECWKVVSTDEYKYEFEKQEENWIYILDFKKMVLLRIIISKYTRIMDGNM